MKKPLPRTSRSPKFILSAGCAVLVQLSASSEAPGANVSASLYDPNSELTVSLAAKLIPELTRNDRGQAMVGGTGPNRQKEVKLRNTT
jgi:hypothetical protein